MTPLQGQLRRLAEPYVFFPLIAAVLLAVVWGTTADMIRVERSVAERSALSSSQELADTYEAQVLRSLREIDHTLRLVKFAWERGGGHVDLRQLREKGLLLPNLVFVVSVADASGKVLATTRTPGPDRIANEDFFRLARESDAIAVGRPRRDHASGEWKVDFARRLEEVDGTFAGVVVISAGADYFVSGY